MALFTETREDGAPLVQAMGPIVLLVIDYLAHDVRMSPNWRHREESRRLPGGTAMAEVVGAVVTEVMQTIASAWGARLQHREAPAAAALAPVVPQAPPLPPVPGLLAPGHLAAGLPGLPGGPGAGSAGGD
jgi:hypothetical protein